MTHSVLPQKSLKTHSQPISVNNIIDIPQEILFHIFSFLGAEDRDGLSLTCKQFRQILHYPHIIYFENTVWRLVSGILDEKITFRPLIRKLDFTDSELPDADLNAVVKHCQRLEKLNLSGCINISDAGVENAASSLIHLKELNLAYTSIQGRCLQDIGNSCRKIEKLTFVHCSKLDFSNVNLAPYAFQNLKEIFFENCSIKGLWHGAMSLSSLEKVTFLDCDVKDTHLDQFTHYMQNVKELMISNCPSITGFFLKTLSSVCKKLEKVDLSGCVNLTDQNLVNLIPALSNVSELNLECCQSLTGSQFKKFATSCPNLKIVQIAGCPELQDRYIFEMLNLTEDYPKGHEVVAQIIQVFKLFMSESNSDLLKKVDHAVSESRIQELMEEHMQSLKTDEDSEEGSSKRFKHEMVYDESLDSETSD